MRTKDTDVLPAVFRIDFKIWGSSKEDGLYNFKIAGRDAWQLGENSAHADASL